MEILIAQENATSQTNGKGLVRKKGKKKNKKHQTFCLVFLKVSGKGSAN